MSQISIGFRVACRDGWAGTLKRLIVNPVSGKVTHLVIELLSSPVSVTVPVKHLSALGYETVFLTLTSSQLENYRTANSL